ncbi:hypothetical protein DPMN_161936 [Dreissena polymorpha]|uniref:Uncharacterized protein n=1 Tax=Dreissena polymorpha TaxID=45954 RepID=A0A9D4ET19_DREPO|nr:hypothetical protein DPMN_161936 [Dreissena polymorpha]
MNDDGSVLVMTTTTTMVVKKMMMVIMVMLMLMTMQMMIIKLTMTDEYDLDLLIEVIVVAFRSKQKSVCAWVLRMASPDTAHDTSIEYMMKVPGHSRCLVDSGFAYIKKLYR